jgi:cell division protein FtsB
MDLPKNLNDAKETIVALTEKITTLEASVIPIDSLKVDNETLQAKVADLTDSNAKLIEQVNNFTIQGASFEQQLVALKDEKTSLESQVTELKKNQKTVKKTAAELVAASASSSPAIVDNSDELTLDDPKEIVSAMAKEKDSKRLFELYEQYKQATKK